MQADVPGTVHTDLLANAKIENPFHRDNELKVQWVAEANWIYRRHFEVPEQILSLDAIYLVAEGLDTFTTIYLNGEKVAQTANMFISHRIDIKDCLVPGKNEIQIRFDSPVAQVRGLEEKYGKMLASHETCRVYARKAQYSFGWDWGPKLPTAGIWRPIYIEAFESIRIKDIFVETRLSRSLSQANLRVHVETEFAGKQNVEYSVVVELDGIRKRVKIDDSQFTIPFQIENPKLWWPAGFGDQHLYELALEIFLGDKSQDQRTITFGIRKVELIQEKDEPGKSFLFKVNNVPIFCKGANWIPADNFIPQIGREKYRKLLKLAKYANMNMLRVWGGGIYEENIFYELCDKLGLLVWQDFMFACGCYPEYEEFNQNVTEEIESVIKRLRNHPSIVLWCGNNENQWIWKRCKGKPLKDMPGFNLFHKIIPDICKNLDATRPYWPSSPFGGGDPNSEKEGNHHQWDIWSNWADFTFVKHDHGRFIAEFGLQAPANITTFDSVIGPEDRRPQSEIVEFHNKQEEGTERLFRFLVAHLHMPTSFEDFIYKCQVVQGEALKHCIEHWRRNKFRTSGTLIWQLNDCWPVTSWSLIDNNLKPKAAYFYAKKAFSPLLVSLIETNEKIEVWVINDTVKALKTTLILTGLNFEGESYFSKKMQLNISENSAIMGCQFDRLELEMNSTACQYLKAELLVGSEIVSENRLYFERIKHLRIPKATIQKNLEKINEREYVLKLCSSHFAKSVRVDSDFNTKIADNYFDLDANCLKAVNISLREDKELSMESILIHSLSNAIQE